MFRAMLELFLKLRTQCYYSYISQVKLGLTASQRKIHQLNTVVRWSIYHQTEKSYDKVDWRTTIKVYEHTVSQKTPTISLVHNVSKCWLIFTARSSYPSAVLGIVILSVRPSLHLSVRHTRALWRNESTYCRYFDTAWKSNHSSFLLLTEVGGRYPLPLEICA